MAWSLLKRAPGRRTAGEALYGQAVEQARRPEFYTRLGVPDSANGRFEIYSLHVLLLLRRLKGAGEPGAQTAQVLFDTFISSLDDALREQGVGDLSVGKKMRKLGEAFYGRVKSYDEALEALPDMEALRVLVARTVCADGGNADGITAYAACGAEALAGLGDEDVLNGKIRWPEVAS
jgi:cytochrome b pre-mRNA-processing protein 3